MRPDWDLWFMRLAYVVAQRGSCPRKQVGAVLVRDQDRSVLATGYNGAPRGLPDCTEVGCDVRSIDGRDSCVRSLHAESNALDLHRGGSMPGHGSLSLYTTVIPCRNCAMRILQHGIRRVVYHEFYQSQGTLETEALLAQRTHDRLAFPPVVLERLDVPRELVCASYVDFPHLLRQAIELSGPLRPPEDRPSTMTYGDLLRYLQGDAARRAPQELAMPVVVRVEDRLEKLHLGDLYQVSVDAGCTDKDALLLDASQNAIHEDEEDDDDAGETRALCAKIAKVGVVDGDEYLTDQEEPQYLTDQEEPQ